MGYLYFMYMWRWKILTIKKGTRVCVLYRNIAIKKLRGISRTKFSFRFVSPPPPPPPLTIFFIDRLQYFISGAQKIFDDASYALKDTRTKRHRGRQEHRRRTHRLQPHWRVVFRINDFLHFYVYRTIYCLSLHTYRIFTIRIKWTSHYILTHLKIYKT